MRILHIITRLILGGAQQNTVMSCRAQAAAGHEAHLAFGPIYGPEGSLLDEAKASGASIHIVPSMRRAVLPWHDAACYVALRRLVRRVRPDVVHTHSTKAGILGRAAAWAEHVPAVVHTVHGLAFHAKQPKLLHRGYIAAEKWAARRCHHLIGITEAMVEAFDLHGIAGRERFTVIPSGVDASLFELAEPREEVRRRVRDELGIPPDAPVVGIVARLDALKGQGDLLDILPRLRERLPEARLLFVGDGWHRGPLERRVARDGLNDAVVFTGLVTQKRVAELLRAMDVMTLPSYQEGQSRTLVEALMCRVPIVGYAVGGIPEICIDGQTGRLAPVGDHEALLEHIAWMLEHPDEASRLAQAGHEHVMARFEAGSMARRLEAVYTQLLPADRSQ